MCDMPFGMAPFVPASGSPDPEPPDPPPDLPGPSVRALISARPLPVFRPGAPPLHALVPPHALVRSS